MKDIMQADTYGIDYNCGENNLVREPKDFDTVAKTESLIESVPNAGKKAPLDSMILNADKQPV